MQWHFSFGQVLSEWIGNERPIMELRDTLLFIKDGSASNIQGISSQLERKDKFIYLIL